jgi:hypothetical protein
VSPGRHFEAKFGPQPRAFLEATAVPKLREAVEEALRNRFDKPDGRDGSLVSSSCDKEGVHYGFLWRRRGAVIGVLALNVGPVPQEVIHGYKNFF